MIITNIITIIIITITISLFELFNSSSFSIFSQNFELLILLFNSLKIPLLFVLVVILD